MSNSVYDIPVKTIQGNETTLNQYQGKVLLIVNTASKCGLTPQYEGLEKLYQDKKEQGLEILGFPANNFLAQEPGSDEEIQEFCSLNYQVAFPLFSKISVAGEDKHQLYQNPGSFGPMASQVLADYGAEVIKIEPPGGDSTRYTGPAVEPGMAAMFMGSNRSKKSVVLDLKKPEAVENAGNNAEARRVEVMLAK